MSLNPLYLPAPSLEMYFVDKTTGLPLAGGTVEFWKDNNRSVPKPVYTIGGTPPNYTYTALPTTSTLSAVGTFQDAGNNNVLPYYYPYDADGNVELYYIEVFDSNGVLQFTREGWPNIAPGEASESSDNLFNFIPNGQFLLHNNLPADALNKIPAGQIRSTFTEIAQGGWLFQKSGLTSIDNVSFPVSLGYTTNPQQSPRYEVRVICSSPDITDTYKTLDVRFYDVNKFASDTQEYTLSFNAVTYLSANFNITVQVQKFFGTGGSPSPTQLIQIDSHTITNTRQDFVTSGFVFGANTGQVIGTNGDDYVQINITFPTNISFGADFTNFLLVNGNFTAPVIYPQITNSDYIDRSLVPFTPDPNGFDMYLPLVLTANGLQADHSIVGTFIYSSEYTAPQGYLNCDNTAYPSNGYSSDGIPYRRLRNKLVTLPVPNSTNIPIFGTGVNYATATYSEQNPYSLILTTNKSGAQTPVSDGGVPTGFPIFTIANGSNYDFNSNVYGDGTTLWAYNNVAGQVTGNIGPGTSGLTINTIPDTAAGEIIGTDQTPQLISIGVNTIPSPGTYFLIANISIISLLQVQYYVWFTVDGTGSDPAPGGTGIRINLRSSMNKFDIAYCIACTLAGNQLSIVYASSGAGLPPNSYWTFNANSQLYYVWYSLNNSGTDPSIPGGIGISVPYQTSDSAPSISFSTIYYINDMYFAVPNKSNVTIKCWDPIGSEDINNQYRFSMTRYSSNDALPHYIGTFQYGNLLSHSHRVFNYNQIGSSGQVATNPLANWSFPLAFSDGGIPGQLIQNTGTAQNNVFNMYLNLFIKY